VKPVPAKPFHRPGGWPARLRKRKIGALLEHHRAPGESRDREVICDTVIIDAIRNRLEHSALTINITGPSYRGAKLEKLASEKEDA
jgi:hypothetical protein